MHHSGNNWPKDAFYIKQCDLIIISSHSFSQLIGPLSEESYQLELFRTDSYRNPLHGTDNTVARGTSLYTQVCSCPICHFIMGQL